MFLSIKHRLQFVKFFVLLIKLFSGIAIKKEICTVQQHTEQMDEVETQLQLPSITFFSSTNVLFWALCHSALEATWTVFLWDVPE